MLKMKKLFHINIGVEYKALININYSNNYNEIFENNSLELNKQTMAINKLDIYLNIKLSNEIEYENKYKNLF